MTRTVIFSYGARDPVEGADLVEQQLRRAHRYRNRLAEIERKRREDIGAVQRDHDRLGPLIAAIDSAETIVAECRQEIRALRSGREEKLEIADQRELLEAAHADLSILRWLRGWAKAVSRGDVVLLAAYDEINQHANDAIKALRTSDEAPYWGTYLVIEEAAQRWRKAPDPPRFVRFDGSGRCAVQLQGGLSVDEAHAGADTRLRVLPAPQLEPPREPKSRRQVQRSTAYGIVHFCRCGNMEAPSNYRLVKIRIGSNGRAPIWATFPVLLDRPLPADGTIKWAWAIRKRHGVRFKWELQFVVTGHRQREH